MTDIKIYYKLFTVIDKVEEEINTFNIDTILTILECRNTDKLYLKVSEYNIISEIDKIVIKSIYNKDYLEKLPSDHFKDFLNDLVSFGDIEIFKQWY